VVGSFGCQWNTSKDGTVDWFVNGIRYPGSDGSSDDESGDQGWQVDTGGEAIRIQLRPLML